MRFKLDSYIARRFAPDKIRFYCLVFLLTNIALVGARFATATAGQSAFGYPLARDYTAFYIAGKIANEKSFLSAYDLDLQTKQYHELLPKEPSDSQLPYVNPPFTLPGFSLLSRLPYAWAFAVWLVISFALYAAGLWLLLRSSSRLPDYARVTAFMLALAFAPFLIYCWGLGQLSSIGVFCLALAIYFERTGRLLLSGLVLSLCLYKPPLLILIPPMLILTRRFRTLIGLAIGFGTLIGISASLVGWRGLQLYATVVYNFQRWKATANTISQTSLYVDVRTAFKLFIDAHPASHIVVLAVYIGGMLLLAWAWWRIGRHPLAWALTITWSLVLNVYTPIYDATLLVIPSILVADHLYGLNKESLPEAFKVVILFLYTLPLSYVFLANRWGFQIFTLVIVAFGIYQIRVLLNAYKKIAGQQPAI
ncbi:MAG TPA: glycosyltransferase family 87 protein [Pyrinomonadaceae bacterium]|nr:glycosyltransferase family 87 protein [Pyrinomonadaceae bacterium]